MLREADLHLPALRAIIAVLDHQSFRKAGEALGLPQSVVSRRVRALEDAVGISLFHRGPDGTRPTTAGSVFIEQARRITTDLSEAVQEIQRAGEGQQGQLRIGCQISLTTGPLRDTILAFKREHQDIEILFSENQQSRLMGELNSRSLDVVFLVASPSDVVGDNLALWTEQIIVALPAEHPLASRHYLEWADLVGERILVPKHDTSLDIHDHILGRVVPVGLQPGLIRHETSRETIITLCGLGWGITWTCNGFVPVT